MSQKQHHKDDDNQTENDGAWSSKPSRPADCHRWYDRYRSLPRGRAFSLPNRTFNHPSIYTNWYLMYLMMRAIGEMLYMDPDQHTFINFITKYLGKGWGFFSGWSYWVSLIFLGMAEITAVSTYVQYCSQVGLPGRFRLSSCLS